jgi:DNA-binding response OmpR family regulator
VGNEAPGTRIPEAEPAGARAEAPPGARRILVVDDELLILELLTEVFGREGFTVDAAPDGARAEALARRNRHDVILMDVRLPGASGPETAVRISSFRPDVPFIFMTGFGNLPGEERMPPRTRAVVDKPLDLAGLRALVLEAMGRPPP